MYVCMHVCVSSSAKGKRINDARSTVGVLTKEVQRLRLAAKAQRIASSEGKESRRDGEDEEDDEDEEDEEQTSSPEEQEVSETFARNKQQPRTRSFATSSKAFFASSTNLRLSLIACMCFSQSGLCRYGCVLFQLTNQLEASEMNAIHA